MQITGNAPHPGREKLKVLIEKMEQVPSIPATLSQLLVKMNNTDVTIKEIEQVIKQDPSLAAKILSCANSAYYGFAKEIVDLSTAISLLGLKTIKQVTVGYSVFSCFQNPHHFLSVKIRDIFRHSYAVGLAAEELAKGNHLMKDAPAFICGLLHDIGKMALIHLLDHHYHNIIEISVDKNIPIEQVEKEILGFDHTDAGAWVLQKWGLPEIMTITAGYHHRLHEVNNLMPHLISLSDRMINHIEINCTERTVNNDSLPNIPENLELSDQDLYATALRICEHKMQIDALSLT